MQSAFVFLSDGFEEVEAVTPIDYLRRAGIKTVTVGVSGKTVISARKIPVVCDITLKEAEHAAETASLVVLPGGMPNSKTLAENISVKNFSTTVLKNGGFLGAICAASALALGSWGFLDGKKFTCYPGFDKDLTTKVVLGKRVIKDGNIITACGPGAAEEFAFMLIEALCGTGVMNNIKSEVIAR